MNGVKGRLLRPFYSYAVLALAVFIGGSLLLASSIEMRAEDWKNDIIAVCKITEVQVNRIVNVPHYAVDQLNKEQNKWVKEQAIKTLDVLEKGMDLLWEGTIYALDKYLLVGRCALETIAQSSIDTINTYAQSMTDQVNQQTEATNEQLRIFSKSYGESQREVGNELDKLLEPFGALGASSTPTFPVLDIPDIPKISPLPIPSALGDINVHDIVENMKKKITQDYSPGKMMREKIPKDLLSFNATPIKDIPLHAIQYCEHWDLKFINDIAACLTHVLYIISWISLALLICVIIGGEIRVWWEYRQEQNALARALAKKERKSRFRDHLDWLLTFMWHKPCVVMFSVGILGIIMIGAQRALVSRAEYIYQTSLVPSVTNLIYKVANMTAEAAISISTHVNQTYGDAAQSLQRRSDEIFNSMSTLNSQISQSMEQALTPVQQELSTNVPIVGPATLQMTSCLSQMWKWPMDQLRKLSQAHINIPSLNLQLDLLLNEDQIKETLLQSLNSFGHRFFNWYAAIMRQNMVCYIVLCAFAGSYFFIGIMAFLYMVTIQSS